MDNFGLEGARTYHLGGPRPAGSPEPICRNENESGIHDYTNKDNADLTREQLAQKYGEVYDTAEVQKHFAINYFCAPFVQVERLCDGKLGFLEFTHSPRYYFNFQEDAR